MSGRRDARDYERRPQYSEAHLNWALIAMTPRHLTRQGRRTGSWTKKADPMWPSLDTLNHQHSGQGTEGRSAR